MITLFVFSLRSALCPNPHPNFFLPLFKPLPVSCHSRLRLWKTSSSILLSHLLGPDNSPLYNLHSTEQEVIQELLLRPVPRPRFFENTVSKLRKFSSTNFSHRRKYYILGIPVLNHGPSTETSFIERIPLKNAPPRIPSPPNACHDFEVWRPCAHAG
jgi:hypothetical protein